jgi:hypothetical protein
MVETECTSRSIRMARKLVRKKNNNSGRELRKKRGANRGIDGLNRPLFRKIDNSRGKAH